MHHRTVSFLLPAILFGILAGYIVAVIMTFVLPNTGVDADGAKYTYSWVVNFSQVKDAAWIAIPSFMGFGALSDVKMSFQASAIIPIGLMFIVTAIETVGDISACIEGGMDREATDTELSGGVICDGLGSAFAAFFGVLPNTSFSQNVGLVSMTKVVNRFAISMGAIFLILCGFCPKIGSYHVNNATVCFRRCGSYDVCINPYFRYPAYHKRAYRQP